MPFVKLDVKILDSSIWIEPSDVRVCWITLLAMADANGLVESTAPGISRRACLSLEATRQALEVFEAPDPDSKNPDNDGRRIQRVEGGYVILNYEIYRKKDHLSSERVRRFREKRKAEALQQPEPVTPAAGEEKISKEKDIDVLAKYVLQVLKFPMTDRGKTEALLQQFGLEKMLAAVDRMKRYVDHVKLNKLTQYVIGRHWRNLYERIDNFSSDENLAAKLLETTKANAQQAKVDGRTVSSDFSSDLELQRKRREQGKQEGAENV